MNAPFDGVEDRYPLAPLQEGMLYEALRRPDARVYFNQVTLPLLGPLREPALRAAWGAALDRHAALRTRFLWEGVPEPVQVVERHVELPWAAHDLRGLPVAAQAGRLESIRAAARGRGFTLTRAPLLRIDLVRDGEESHHLVFSHHHLLLDGWSLFLVLREVLERYEGIPSGPCPPPYRDFVAWLRQRDPSTDTAFYRRSLAGLHAPTPLAVDHAPTSPRHGDDTSAERLVLPPGELESLRAAARAARATLGTLVQAAWALRLARYADQRDVLFGTVVSGRPLELPGADSMVGLFMNTVPTRVTVREDLTVAAWLDELQTRQLEALEHQQARLVDALAASDLPRGRPGFESLLLFENYRKSVAFPWRGPTLRVEEPRWFEWFSDPLTALAVPGEDGLELRLVYHPSRFERPAVIRMLGHWKALLQELAARPSTLVSELDMRRNEPVSITSGPRRATPPLAVHELVSATAARRPDAEAVVCGERRLSYGELIARSSRLAARLRALGVGPEDRVGVALGPRLDLPVALLGVLASGAAYVPLDPAHPAERLRFMATDARLRAMVTLSSLLDRVPATGTPLVCLDREDAPEPEAPGRAPEPVGPERLAYVIYTSGSTGWPKGVGVPHGAVVNLLESMRETPGFDEGGTLLSVTSLGFDIAALELFLPLVAGGRLELAARDEVSDGERLRERLSASGATLMQATPSTWRLLVEAGWSGDPNLTALVGGEPLPARLARELHARCRAVYNAYGPTETTIWSTLWRVEPGPVLIGDPIANTTVQVLDRRMRSLPPGVAGELFLGGAGVARGYWGRAALTAERFLPDPLGRGRVYRTGDRVRQREDGSLEFLERLDHQVKLRGHRIEPGEIEAALEELPAVVRAVVLLREDVPGDPRLVAYVVPAPGDASQPAELREALRRRLPEVMVPASYVRMDAFPLTPSGKVDRRTLPAPDRDGTAAGSFSAPEGALEARVAAIWGEALGVSRVGRDDSFFDLGGHSLLLLKVRNLLADALDPTLTILDLFTFPTVRTLAARLAGRAGAEASAVTRAEDRRERLRGLLQRRRGATDVSTREPGV